MTTFNFRGLPDCFVRMIRFFVLSDLVENTLEQLAAMVAMSRPKELRQLEVVLDPRFKFETSFFSTFAIIQPLMKVSCHIECNFLHIFLTLSSCRD